MVGPSSEFIIAKVDQGVTVTHCWILSMSIVTTDRMQKKAYSKPPNNSKTSMMNALVKNVLNTNFNSR